MASRRARKEPKVRTIDRSIKIHKLLGRDGDSEIGIVGVSSWEESVARMTSSMGTGVLVGVMKSDVDTKELVTSPKDLVLCTPRQAEWLKHVRSYSGGVSQLLLREMASITLQGGRKIPLYNQVNKGGLKLYEVQPRSARGFFLGLELSLSWLCASLLSGGTREDFKQLRVAPRVAKRFLVYTEKPFALMRGYFRLFTSQEQVYVTGRRQAHWIQDSEHDVRQKIPVFGRQLEAKDDSYFYIFHHILEENVPTDLEHEHDVRLQVLRARNRGPGRLNAWEYVGDEAALRADVLVIGPGMSALIPGDCVVKLIGSVKGGQHLLITVCKCKGTAGDPHVIRAPLEDRLCYEVDMDTDREAGEVVMEGGSETSSDDGGESVDYETSESEVVDKEREVLLRGGSGTGLGSGVDIGIIPDMVHLGHNKAMGRRVMEVVDENIEEGSSIGWRQCDGECYEVESFPYDHLFEDLDDSSKEIKVDDVLARLVAKTPFGEGKQVEGGATSSDESLYEPSGASGEESNEAPDQPVGAPSPPKSRKKVTVGAEAQPAPSPAPAPAPAPALSPAPAAEGEAEPEAEVAAEAEPEPEGEAEAEVETEEERDEAEGKIVAPVRRVSRQRKVRRMSYMTTAIAIRKKREAAAQEATAAQEAATAAQEAATAAQKAATAAQEAATAAQEAATAAQEAATAAQKAATAAQKAATAAQEGSMAADVGQKSQGGVERVTETASAGSTPTRKRKRSRKRNKKP